MVRSRLREGAVLEPELRSLASAAGQTVVAAATFGPSDLWPVRHFVLHRAMRFLSHARFSAWGRPPVRRACTWRDHQTGMAEPLTRPEPGSARNR